MKTTKRLFAILLTALMLFSLAACNKDSGGEVEIPAAQRGSDDFQKNLHQTDKVSFIETDTGWYFSYSSLYYIEKEAMTATRVCAKPDCDHTDDNVCNSRIHADYLLTGGERIYYVGYSNDPKQVQSVKYDATERETVQELKFRETSAAQSSYDQAIYHRGYVYYVSDDVLYRVALGGEKDSAEEIWSPENAGNAQSHGGQIDIDPNGIHYILWAEGDNLYFMANVQTSDGTYKDVLFQCDLADLSVQQIWTTPDKEEVGEWEATGVSVSQWYVTGGYIYFYLSGGDMWRTELATGKLEKLANTHEKARYGSAIFSDEYMALLNDIPVSFYGDTTPTPGSMLRSYGDTIFIYTLDGTFVKEIPISGLYDDPNDMAQIDMLCCSGNDIFFLTTAITVTSGSGIIGPQGSRGAINLCHANVETGEVEVLYNLKKGE